MNIGRTIRLLRDAAGLRQKELAERLGVSQNYLSLLENNKREPSPRLLRRLADVLDVPVSLLTWQCKREAKPADDQERELLDDLDRLMVRLLVKRMRSRE